MAQTLSETARKNAVTEEEGNLTTHSTKDYTGEEGTKLRSPSTLGMWTEGGGY